MAGDRVPLTFAHAVCYASDLCPYEYYLDSSDRRGGVAWAKALEGSSHRELKGPPQATHRLRTTALHRNPCAEGVENAMERCGGNDDETAKGWHG